MTQAPNQAALALSTPQAVALANEGQQVRAACETVRAMPIPDQTALDQFTAGLVEVKERRQALKAGREGECRTHLDELKIIRDKYAPAEDAYEALDAAMRERFARYHAEGKAAREAAQLAAGAAFQAGDNAGAYAALVAAPPPTETHGAGVGEVWAFEFVNEALVPREYCEPVPKLVRATFKPGQKDEPAPIPGVRFFRKAAVRVTG